MGTVNLGLTGVLVGGFLTVAGGLLTQPKERQAASIEAPRLAAADVIASYLGTGHALVRRLEVRDSPLERNDVYPKE